LEENEDKLDEAFKATSKANGLNILVNRHDSQFSLPWPLIYDYYYLEPAIGIPEYPICYGKAFDESTAALDQFRIPARYKEDVRTIPVIIRIVSKVFGVSVIKSNNSCHAKKAWTGRATSIFRLALLRC